MTPQPSSRAPDDDLCVLLVAGSHDARLRRQRALAAAGLAVRAVDGEADAAAQAPGAAVAVIDVTGDVALLRDLLRAVRDAANPPPVVLIGDAGSGTDGALLDALGDDADAVADLLPSDVDDRLLARKVAALARLRAESTTLRRDVDAERARRGREAALGAMMIAVLTHDLRTPLTAVTLSAEIVEKRGSGEAVLAAAARIKSAVARMSATLAHLLNIAAGHGRPVAIEPKVADLATAARAAVDAFAAAHAQPDVTLRSDGDAQALLDAPRLTQALSTLIELATRHGGPTAPVTVDVDGAHRAYLRVRVATPAVFSEDVQASLFSQAPAPGAPPPNVGPALVEVEDVIRAHGGTIVGHSEAGAGTSFDMMLPRPDVPPFGTPGATTDLPADA